MGVGVSRKTNTQGDCRTKGAGQFADSRGGLSKKEGVLLLRRGIDILMHTMYY